MTRGWRASEAHGPQTLPRPSSGPAHRPAAGPVRHRQPVAGAHRRGHAADRSGPLDDDRRRPGRRADPVDLGRAARPAPVGVHRRDPLRHHLVEVRHPVRRGQRGHPARPGPAAADGQPRARHLDHRLHHEHAARPPPRRAGLGRLDLQPPAAADRARRAGPPAGPAPLLLEVGQVGHPADPARPRPAGLLGAQRLPQPRRPLARAALLGGSEPWGEGPHEEHARRCPPRPGARARSSRSSTRTPTR